MILAHVGFVLIHASLHKMRNSCKCTKKIHEKFGAYLYYNGSIRFYLEICFDVALLAWLNLHMADWDTLFIAEEVSNYMSLTFLILTICFSVYLVGFATCRRKEWQ